MAIEIELKARVNNPEKTKTILCNLGTYCYSYEKKDSYWTFPEKDTVRLRIRSEEKTFPNGESTLVCIANCKSREMYGEIEVNNEQEFNITDIDAFEEILNQLGLKPDIKKEKSGLTWKLDRKTGNIPVLAELSEVKGLGWFIELEIISNTKDKYTLEENRSHLLELLELLHIPRDAIEKRPYSELIKISRG